MSKNQIQNKKGFFAYILRDEPDRYVLAHSASGVDPRSTIESVLGELTDTHAAGARKMLGNVLEGRGEVNKHGVYLEQYQVNLKAGGKGVLTVGPTEVVA